MTCLAWVALPGAYDPANITIWVTEANKPPLHVKPVALEEDLIITF
jgi:hypothetical protein